MRVVSSSINDVLKYALKPVRIVSIRPLLSLTPILSSVITSSWASFEQSVERLVNRASEAVIERPDEI